MGNSISHDEKDLKNMTEEELENLKRRNYEQTDELAQDVEVINAINKELTRREEEKIAAMSNEELEDLEPLRAAHFGTMSKRKRASPKRKRVSPKRKRVSPKRKRVSPKRKRVSPKRKRASPKRKTMKLTKKSLDSLSLKKLQKLAVKHKVSIFKKGTKKTKQNLLKKSTLLTKMKKSRSINKILLSAHKMKYAKKY